MKIDIKLLVSAFAGGIALSIIELANMFKQKEIPDMYFFGGLVIAGIIGIAGYFLTGAKDIKTAFASGVSAPQLFGGFIKVGSVGAQAVSLLFCSDVYAETPKIDSVSIVVITQVDNIKIKTNDSIFIVNDSSKIRFKYQDYIIVNMKKIAVPQEKNSIMKIKATESITDKLFRGITAQKSNSKHIDIDFK
jgi:hypothetical protein